MALKASSTRDPAPAVRNFLLLLLLFFFTPALAQDLPSVPLTAAETSLWQDAGFSAASGGEWQYYGFRPAEAREWVKGGIEYPGWANQWKSEGFQAGEAVRWKDFTNVYTAAGFLQAGFGPGEAKIWLDSGVQSSLRAAEYRELGMDAATGARYWRLSIYPEEAGPWYKAGFTAEETLAWRWGPKDVAYYHTDASPYSRQVYSLKAAVAWRQAGFTAEQAQRLSGFRVELDEARAWLAEGFAAAEIMEWRDSGLSPLSARRYLDADLPPAYAEAAEFGATWATGDEIPELAYALELLGDGRIDVLLTMTLINRPGGACGDEFSLPLPRLTQLRYGPGHSRDAVPAYKIKEVEVDGVGAAFRHAGGRLAIPLPADGEVRTVRISYATDDRILSFPHHDELSFAAVSDNPGLVIRRAAIAVRLPPGAELVFTGGEAGLPGREDLVARVEEGTAGKRVVFETTRVLREKMELQVNVAFTKGNVKPRLLGRFKSLDHRSGRALTALLIFLGGLLISSAYFLRVWHQYGRDPQGGAAPNRSAAPGVLSPAEVRQFQTNGRVDGLSLLATLIHLAQQGTLKISESEGRYTLVQESAGMAGLFPAEAALLAGLFADGRELTLAGRSARRRLQQGLRAMRGVLKENFGNYYRANLKYLLPGAVVSALAVMAAVYALRMDEFGEMESFRVFFAVALSLAALAQLTFFRQLLKAPTEGFCRQRDASKGYRNYLETELQLGHDPAGYLTPSQEGHLAFSLALALDLDRMAIRRGQARWFLSKSGPFAVGDFASALRTLGRSFRS